MTTPNVTPAMIEAINADISAIAKILSEKGLRSAYCNVDFTSDGRSKFFLHGYLGDTGTEDFGEFIYFDLDKYDEAFENARATVLDLPSLEEQRRERFRRQLANLIDEGNRFGIDVDFLNPLTETMKKLSENAITHQKTAAE